MKELVFATNNPHKLAEIREILGNRFHIKSLTEIGCNEDIRENGDTLEANAIEKARYVAEKYGVDCFADDTGLEVEALDMQPGVHSARYAGPGRNSSDNIEKLLRELQQHENKNARFRTIIALSINGKILLFEGLVPGKIIDNLRGTSGFGYDPVFVPDGYEDTFAEMPSGIKNSISHRAMAMAALVNYLNSVD